MRLPASAVALLFLFSTSAWAQDDDLAPVIVPKKGAKAPPAKAPPAKAAPAKAPPKGGAAAKAPAPVDDDLAAPPPVKAPAKGGTAAKTPAPADDDLAAPPPVKTPPKGGTAAKTPAPADDDLAPAIGTVPPKGGPGPVISPPVQATGPGLLKLKGPASLTNASVSVDGKEIGTLPLEPLKLAPGEHTVLVKRIGFAVFIKKVTLSAGKALDLEVKMQPVSAVVSVTSDTEDAQVFIDGRLISSVPVTELEMPAKTIELVVRKEGFRDNKQFVTLVAGQDYPIKVKLKTTRGAGTSTLVARGDDRPTETVITPAAPVVEEVVISAPPDNRPLTQRWYFWTGVAAVATAAVVGSVVGISNAQPPRKQTEGEVCTIDCDKCINMQCFLPGRGASAGVLHW